MLFAPKSKLFGSKLHKVRQEIGARSIILIGCIRLDCHHLYLHENEEAENTCAGAIEAKCICNASQKIVSHRQAGN
ncbi:hypothetical protein HYPGJ_30052 [Hyphomicrobium sp. GJ21]|nr:hypothetical protein HYPGJ_30052 [Hyphomicrobium sp. GJ21]